MSVVDTLNFEVSGTSFVSTVIDEDICEEWCVEWIGGGGGGGGECRSYGLMTKKH